MSEPCFVGIDGGGTKTSVVAVDAKGDELARIRTTTSNAAVVGHDVAGATLRSALDDLAAQLPPATHIETVWFGLSGGDRPEDHVKLRPHVVGLAAELRFTNDAELILAALPDGVGVAAVAGTGSIAYGRNRSGAFARAGGWGHVFGDEGSGYDLARRAFAAMAAETDALGPETTLTARLTKELNLSEPFQLIAWVYATARTKGDIARISRLVIDEADRGDPVAQVIVSDSAKELALAISAVVRRLGLGQPVRLALTGGLLTNATRFRDHVINRVAREFGEIKHLVVSDPALAAARSLAHSSSMKGTQ